MDLQAVVGEMDVVVMAVEGVLVAACSNVPVAAHVDLKVVSHQNPNSDVELSVLV